MSKGLMIGGEWRQSEGAIEVRNKYSGDLLAPVTRATVEDVDAAIEAAAEGAREMAALPAHCRAEVLAGTAARVREHRRELGELIAGEAGKPLTAALGEVGRCVSTFTCAAEEAKRIHGETCPLDAVAKGEGYFGYWVRRPVGVMAAISPFNFPINLVAHKLAPAVAAGNSFVLKPASTTPLVATRLLELMLEAGLPPKAANMVCGPGREVGTRMVTDPRVAKVSFTGSAEVGEDILSRAGIKKVTLELGNTSPVIVDEVTDLGAVAARCAQGAFHYQGQVCISVQRIYVRRALFEPFVEKLVAATEALVVGDPLEEETDVGPMISEKEARRVETWVDDARTAGATVRTGGTREGSVVRPAVLTDVTPDAPLVCTEVFGPVVSVMPYDEFEEALRLADDTEYGLQAGVYTRDIDRALDAAAALNFGGVIVNDIPTFRVDHMPYGGNRKSGLGREGLRFAIEDMTNIQLVAIKRS